MSKWDWESFWIAVCVLALIALFIVIAALGFHNGRLSNRETHQTLRACMIYHEPIECYRLVKRG